MVVKNIEAVKPIIEVEKAIRDIIKAKYTSNDDGFYIGNANSRKEVRTLDIKEANKFLDQIDINGLLTHSRLATTGEVTKNNIHGWVIGEWQFMHNGTVYDYSPAADKGKQKDTDSYILFQKLITQINSRGNSNKNVCKAIRKELKDVGFWGRAALYNRKDDRLFMMGDWYTYLVQNQYIIISSSDLEVQKESIIKTNGMKFTQASGGMIGMEIIDGVNIILNFSKDSFQFKSMGELDVSYSWSSKDKTNSPADNKKISEVGFRQDYNHAYDYEEWKDDGHGGLIKLNKPGRGNKPGSQNTIINNMAVMKNQYGEVVSVYEDNTGLHDWEGNCCDEGTCGLFEDLTADEEDEWLKSLRGKYPAGNKIHEEAVSY